MQDQVGPYRMLTSSDGAAVPWYVIPFDDGGRCKSPKTRAHLIETLRTGSFTNIFLFSHGWNNDWRTATERYEAFFKEFSRIRASLRPGKPAAFRPILVGIFWPSTALVLPSEEAPRFAATGDADARLADLRAEQRDQTVDALASSIAAVKRDRFYELVSADVLDRAEVEELATILSPSLGAVDDVVDKAGAMEPDRTEIAEIADAWIKGANLLEALESPAAPADDDDDDDDFGTARGGAHTGAPQVAGWLDKLDPRNLLRLITVWQMKDRAGTVGFNGVGPLLRDILGAADATAGRGRVHLIGHSYGAKVVMSALASAPPPRPVCSALLLQPAFSHLAFTAKVPGAGHPGGYRVVLDRIEQPILSTFSPHDVALRRTFHLAVRRAADLGEVRIAALPTEAPSKFAALGGYGPGSMETSEARIFEIPGAGAPDGALFQPGVKIVGLDGTGVIKGHGDIVRAETAWLLLAQVLR